GRTPLARDGATMIGRSFLPSAGERYFRYSTSCLTAAAPAGSFLISMTTVFPENRFRKRRRIREQLSSRNLSLEALARSDPARREWPSAFPPHLSGGRTPPHPSNGKR